MRIDQLKLGPKLDGRRKLPASKHKTIRRLYASGKWSQRELARKYNVSRRLITFILYPERELKQKQAVKRERRWLRYYDREKHTESIRNLRQKKRELLQAKLIK